MYLNLNVHLFNKCYVPFCTQNKNNKLGLRLDIHYRNKRTETTLVICKNHEIRGFQTMTQQTRLQKPAGLEMFTVDAGMRSAATP